MNSHRTLRPFPTVGRRLRLAEFALAVFAVVAGPTFAAVGANLPWTTYEAEAMTTTGEVLGPRYEPHRVEMESSGLRCVKLRAAHEYVEFAATVPANTLVVRYSLPDAPAGGGRGTTLTLSVNGQVVRSLGLTSRFSHLYGAYPFSNDPSQGKPRNFYDEIRVKDVALAPGDLVRLEKAAADDTECIVDLVDLEAAPVPLARPPASLSVLDFGAGGQGATDDTEALRRCIAAAVRERKCVWVPAGEYRLSGDIVLTSPVTIQGAGMWHTTFVGDEARYAQADRRVRFKLAGERIHLADFAIVGWLNYRNDDEPNDGVVGARCSASTVSRLWIEHTKVGVWIYNGTDLTIEGCRFRNLLADGVNLCVGTSGTVVSECSARGTGDDCFAIWPVPSDQGFDQFRPPGHNVIRHCTGQLPFLANGGALYGGAGNRIESCRFIDILTGSGILISTTFPTSDEAKHIDNNFSGTTVVRDCDLVRCGGYDHAWAWRGALQFCMDRRSITGVEVTNVTIRDTLSDAISVVGPGSAKGEGTLAQTKLERVKVERVGLGTQRHGLSIREDARGGLQLVDSSLGEIRNDSKAFSVGAP